MKVLGYALVGFLTLTTLAACGKKDESNRGQTVMAADGSGKVLSVDGACAQSVLDTRNDLASSYRNMKADKTSRNAQTIIDRCLDFKSMMGPNTCQAVDKDTQASRTVGYTAETELFCERMIDDGVQKATDEWNNGIFD